MENNPLVSIITPMYNSQNTVGETIKSVLAQTYKNWEMLVVDDKSTDNSVEIVSEYCKVDSRIKLFKLEKNIGTPYFARNFATDESKGDLIAFLDSDDIWLPSKLTKQVEFIITNNYPIVYSYYERISNMGVRSDRMIKSPLKTDYSAILKNNPIGCLTAIYNKNIIGKLHQINHKHEDYIMWISALQKGHTAYCYPEVLALYRISNNSVSNSKLEMAKVTWDIYRNVFKFDILTSLRSFFYYSINGVIKFFK